MKRTKEQKGITLIALIITIVVLLILAAVAISSITNDGILSYAQNAAKDYNQAVKNEQEMLDILTGELENISKDQCEHEYGEWEITKQATCEDVGTKQKTCSICGSKETESILAIGHSYTETGRVAATCTTTGTVTYTCGGCGDTYNETLEKLSHTVVTDAAVSATCTTSGLTQGSHCSVCNTVLTAQQTVPATGHQNTTIINASAGYTGDTYCNDCKTTIETGENISVTITVTGTGLRYYVEISHNGEVYVSPSTFTANVGDTISCRVTECWYSQYIYLNGNCVDGGYGENDISFDYTVVSDATIDLYENGADTKRERNGMITITDENS